MVYRDDGGRARRARELLSRVRIASPCPASWEAMAGDDRKRHCGLCDKAVYDLSAMSAVEGLRLIRDSEGTACLRLYRRRDGLLQTSDCAVGPRRRKKRRLELFASAAVGAAMGGAAAWTAATTPEPMELSYQEPPPPKEERLVMGRMEPPPPDEPAFGHDDLDPAALGILGGPMIDSADMSAFGAVLDEAEREMSVPVDQEKPEKP